MDTVIAGTGAVTQLNENFIAVQPASTYGRRAPGISGLTWAYYGGRGFGNSIADGTAVLTASATNYIVANRTTGAVSAATTTTNWNDSTNYYRLYQVVTGASTITSYTDYREFTGGGGAGGSAAGSDKQIQYNASGAFGAEAGFEYDYSSNTLSVSNATFTGLASTAASTAGGAGFRLPHGAAPTAPTNGDVWTTTAGLFARINGATVGPYGAGGGMSNPMTATGDIIYSSSGSTPARLGIGSTNQVLTVVGGVPAWQNAASGFSNPMTTAGDIIIGDTGGAAIRLPAGSAGQVLTMVSGAPAWAAGGGGGGLTNWTEAVNTASPNATVPVVSLTATNAATNVDAAIPPKGTGALSAHAADGASTGGGKRGPRAVDWQMQRTSSGQVASGNNSVIAGGQNNIASGNFSVIGGGAGNTASASNATVAGGISCQATSTYATVGGGNTNIAGGAYSFIGGGNANTASANFSSVGGGSSNTASGDYSAVLGGYQATTRGLYGTWAWASGVFASPGDAQEQHAVLRATTTNATTTGLAADGGTPVAATSVVLPNNSMYCFEATVSAKVTTFGDRAAFKITGAISRGANAAATQIDGTVTVTTVAAIGGASAWTVTAVANTTLGSLEIRVTGVAGTTIKWVAEVKTLQLVG